MLDSKKLAIKNSIQKTREKRKLQDVRVFELKINESKLNKQQNQHLNKLFIEAKWYYNYLLSLQDPFNSSVRKIKTIKVKTLTGFEERRLEVLSSQMKQSLHVKICDSIYILSKIKKLGKKVGRLKFKPEINSIDLPQYKITWKFTQKDCIKIQGLKKPIKVFGIHQFFENFEFANAKLVRKPSGCYIHVTAYSSKQEKQKTDKEVGIDFGIKDNLVTSDNEKFNCNIPESKKLKRLQRHKARKKKNSKNSKKLQIKINKEYENIKNKKKDFVHKTVSYLNNKYDKIYIQDELIKLWQKQFFGKQVQHSILGATKTKLKSLESVHVIEAKHPTTKLCYKCLNKLQIKLSERIFKCSCGLNEERDLKSAKTILLIGQNKISLSSWGTYEYTCGENVKPQLSSAEEVVFNETGSC